MPLHIHPWFRNHEKAMENSGLIAPLNSDGYNELSSAQKQGQAYEQIPVALTFLFNNTSYTSSE